MFFLSTGIFSSWCCRIEDSEKYECCKKFHPGFIAIIVLLTIAAAATIPTMYLLAYKTRICCFAPVKPINLLHPTVVAVAQTPEDRELRISQISVGQDAISGGLVLKEEEEEVQDYDRKTQTA